MRKLFIRTALIAGAALAVSACNRHPATNNVTANDLGANMTMGAPANDASAIESVSNNVQPVAPASNSADNSTRDSGAGTSTNNVESNTVGM